MDEKFDIAEVERRLREMTTCQFCMTRGWCDPNPTIDLSALNCLIITGLSPQEREDLARRDVDRFYDSLPKPLRAAWSLIATERRQAHYVEKYGVTPVGIATYEKRMSEDASEGFRNQTLEAFLRDLEETILKFTGDISLPKRTPRAFVREISIKRHNPGK